MGHTVKSQRRVTDLLLGELKDYGRSLREEDRIAYERLLKIPLKHMSNISFVCSANAWSFLLMSIMCDLEKRIARTEDINEGLVNGYLQKEEYDCYMDQE
jgi:hypothetical protein